MKMRWFVIFLCIVGLPLALVCIVGAQGDDSSPRPSVSAAQGIGGLDISPIPLGQPGLSFRYVQTLGITETAYFSDCGYLNHPHGVGLDRAGNLWVAELLGARAIKCSAAGACLASIGVAGFTAESDQAHFAAVADVSVDREDNVWVVDSAAHRVVKYDPMLSRVLLQLGETGKPGRDNSHFDSPSSIAFNSVGNLYVSDTNNHRVQVFDPAGRWLATIGVTGMPDWGNQYFNHPRHICIDNADNLYVADSDNHRVQIFSRVRVYIGTIGKRGERGDDYLHLNSPHGVAVDACWIYVADTGNHRVQIFDRNPPYACLYTLGSGIAGEGDDQFNLPADVAVDSAGNVYVADEYNQRVQKFVRLRSCRQTIGGTGGPAGSGYLLVSHVYEQTFGRTGTPYLTDAHHYNEPWGVAMDRAGNVALAETKGHRLIMLNAAGAERFVIGEAGIPGSDNAHLDEPQGVAFDAAGNVYVADMGNNRVQVFSADGTYLLTLGSGPGTGPYNFKSPCDVAVAPNGNIYVVDKNNHRVQVYSSSGTYAATLGVTGEAGSDNRHFSHPCGVWVDEAGDVYVADTDNHRVQRFNSRYSWQMTLGETGVRGSGFDHLNSPIDVAIDAAGRIYVVDAGNNRMQVFERQTGAYLTTIGGMWGGRAGQFRGPRGIYVNQAGSVYISDLQNHRIVVFAPGVNGWRQANINGFGMLINTAASALSEFSAALYVGTANSTSGAEVWRLSGSDWTQVVAGGLVSRNNITVNCFAEFGGHLYAGTANPENGAQVWQSPTVGTPRWHPVIINGFDRNNSEVVKMIATADYLYAGTRNPQGAQIWRLDKSDQWSKVERGPDSSNECITSFADFDGYLYAGTRRPTGGGQLWRSRNGSIWERVVSGGFDNADNRGIDALAAFNGRLYAGTWNESSGAEIWRSADGQRWEPVMDGGFGNTCNLGIPYLVVFDGALHAIVSNAETGAEVWRSFTGDTGWERIAHTGFGCGAAVDVRYGDLAAIHESKLYVGTADAGSGGRVWMRDQAIQGLKAANDGPTALGHCTTLTAAITVGTNVTYTWNFGDSTDPGYGAVVTHCYTPAATYVATVTASNLVSVVTATTTVTVDKTIEGLKATNDSPTAFSKPTTLTATIAAGSRVTYTWNFNDGTSPQCCEPVVTHVYSPTDKHGIYWPVVTATNSVSTLTDTTKVTIDEAIGGLRIEVNGSRCAGSLITMTAVITAGTNVTFTWDFGALMSPMSGKMVTVTLPVGTHVVTVTARNSLTPDGVTATTPVGIDEPIEGLTAKNSGPAPPDTPITFTAENTRGSRVNYTWYFGDGITKTGKTVTHAYTLTGTHVATVTACNLCDVPPRCPTATTSVDVDVPIVGLSVNSSSPTRLGDETTLTVTMLQGSRAECALDFGDGTQPYSAMLEDQRGVLTVTHSYSSCGEYTAIVTATNSLSRTTGITARTPVTVQQAIAGLYIAVEGLSTVSSPITFTANITAGTNVTFVWDWGDGSMHTDRPETCGCPVQGICASTVTHAYAHGGRYPVVVTATNSVSLVTATITIEIPYCIHLPVIRKVAKVKHSWL